jgi:hypothetical protein
VAQGDHRGRVLVDVRDGLLPVFLVANEEAHQEVQEMTGAFPGT